MMYADVGHVENDELYAIYYEGFKTNPTDKDRPFVSFFPLPSLFPPPLLFAATLPPPLKKKNQYTIYSFLAPTLPFIVK